MRGLLPVDRGVLAIDQFVAGVEHGDIVQREPAALGGTAHRLSIGRVGRLDHLQIAVGTPADLIGRQPRLALEAVEVDLQVVGDQFRSVPAVVEPGLIGCARQFENPQLSHHVTFFAARAEVSFPAGTTF